MKRILCILLGILLLPFMLIAVSIYAVLSILQLLFRTINIGIELFMMWVDKNITNNII